MMPSFGECKLLQKCPSPCSFLLQVNFTHRIYSCFFTLTSFAQFMKVSLTVFTLDKHCAEFSGVIKMIITIQNTHYSSLSQLHSAFWSFKLFIRLLCSVILARWAERIWLHSKSTSFIWFTPHNVNIFHPWYHGNRGKYRFSFAPHFFQHFRILKNQHVEHDESLQREADTENNLKYRIRWILNDW